MRNPPFGRLPSPPPTADQALLMGYRWHLTDARSADRTRLDVYFPSENETGRPVPRLTLVFDATSFSANGGCNTISSDYELVFGWMRGNLMTQTLMGCSGPLGDLDTAVMNFLRQDIKFTLTRNSTPRLDLESAAGDRLTFTGEATPETRYGQPGEKVFFEIGRYMVPCKRRDSAQRDCLKARVLHLDPASSLETSPPDPWETLREPIEGYTHEDGATVKVIAKRFVLDSPSADGSNVAYTLVGIYEYHRPTDLP